MTLKTKVVALRLDRKIVDQLQKHAQQNKMTLSELLRDYIMQSFNDQNTNTKQIYRLVALLEHRMLEMLHIIENKEFKNLNAHVKQLIEEIERRLNDLEAV